MQPRGLGQRLVPAHRPRRRVGLAAAAARRGPGMVDEVQHAPSRRGAGNRHRGREGRRHHDPELARIPVQADFRQLLMLQRHAVGLPRQDRGGLRANPGAGDAEDARLRRPVPDRAHALLQVAALGHGLRDALERALRPQRGQAQGRALAAARAEVVDLGIKIGRGPGSGRVQRRGEEKQGGHEANAGFAYDNAQTPRGPAAYRVPIMDRKPLAGAALALLLYCSGVPAQILVMPPTAFEAHEFLASTFQRYRIDYVVWYGAGTRDNYRGRTEFYGGRDCLSELGTGRANRAFAVDWSRVSSVAMSGADAIYVSGQLIRAAQNPDARDYANFHLYFPNAKVARSVSNAFEVLRLACQRSSKFG